MAVNYLIDGMMSGTGVRDAVNGGYVEPSNIGLSEQLSHDILAWQARCKDAHIAGFPEALVMKLDEEGCSLTQRAKSELPDQTIGYYSDGQMRRLI